MIYTSLAEIASFKPCANGWRNILKGQGKAKSDTVLFPLVDALKSNSISDICWLLGKKRNKKICIQFAQMCADSVEHLKNSRYIETAAYAAAAVDAAAAYADAASAAYTAAYAAAAAARAKQKELNKEFMRQCLEEAS